MPRDRSRHFIGERIARQPADDAARDPQRMRIVLGEMVHDAGYPGVHFAAAQFLGAHHFAGGGFHQRRAAEKNRALVAHDDGFVAHRRDVGAARGARAHDHRDLRNARRRHVGLVEEDAPEVFLVGKHLVLAGQVRAARVHQVHTGQAVFFGHALRAQVLLHRDRVIRAALHRRVVAHHHALAPGDAADAGDDAGAGRLVAVHAEGGQRRQLEEGRAGVEQHLDAIAGQQFAARRRAWRGPPRRRPAPTRCCRLRNSSTSARIAAWLAANSALFLSTLDSSSGMIVGQ